MQNQHITNGIRYAACSAVQGYIFQKYSKNFLQ